MEVKEIIELMKAMSDNGMTGFARWVHSPSPDVSAAMPV